MIIAAVSSPARSEFEIGPIDVRRDVIGCGEAHSKVY